MYIVKYHDMNRATLIDGRAKLPESPVGRSSGASISSFRVAESMVFNGEFRQWEELLRVGE
jgi:hypothetical protein